jgi:DNA-binding protein HU-beta
MAKAPAAITSPKTKKLARKASKSPSMMTTAETRELGTSVFAHLSPPKEGTAVPLEKAPAKKTPATKAPAKKMIAKKAPAKRS